MGTRASCCAIAVALLIGAIATTNATADKGQVLRRGAFGEPQSLDPDRSGVHSEIAIVMDLFEGLTTFDAAGRVVPGQAKSWHVSEDGLRYTFSLRPELHWSDGEPLRAADFVYSFRRTMAPTTRSTQADRLAIFRNGWSVLRGERDVAELGVAAPNPDTLVIELEHPVPRLPLLLAYTEGFPLPRHSIEVLGENWREPGRMVSNGPFTLAQRKPHDRVVLKKNPHYHAQASVNLDEIIYFPSDGLATSVQRFRAGELDFNAWPGFLPRQEEFLRKQLGNAVQVSPLLIVAYLRFNLEQPALQDIRVRQALSMSVDRHILADRVLGGGEQPAWSVVPPNLSKYGHVDPTDEAPRPQRLAQAKQLLKQAGFGADKPLQLTLRYPSGQGREICVAVQAMWRDLPVAIEIENSEIKSMIADLRRGNFDLALTGALDGDDPERFLDRLLPNSSYNTGRYNSRAFLALMQQAKHTANATQRTELLRRAEMVVSKDVPVIPLYYGVSRNLVAPQLSGFKGNPADIHLSRYLTLTANRENYP